MLDQLVVREELRDVLFQDVVLPLGLASLGGRLLEALVVVLFDYDVLPVGGDIPGLELRDSAEALGECKERSRVGVRLVRKDDEVREAVPFEEGVELVGEVVGRVELAG